MAKLDNDSCRIYPRFSQRSFVVRLTKITAGTALCLVSHLLAPLEANAQGLLRFLGINESPSSVISPKDNDHIESSRSVDSKRAPDSEYGPLGPLLIQGSPQVRSDYVTKASLNNSLFDKVLERLQPMQGISASEYLKQAYPLGFKLSDLGDCKKYNITLPVLRDLSPTLNVLALYRCSPKSAILLLEVQENGKKAIYVIDPYNFNKLDFSYYVTGSRESADRAGSRSVWFFTADSYQGVDQYEWANIILKRIASPSASGKPGSGSIAPDPLKEFGIALSWCDRKCLDDIIRKTATAGKGPSFVSPGSWIGQANGAFLIARVSRGSRADRGCLMAGDLLMTMGSYKTPGSIQDVSTYIESATQSVELDVQRLERGSWTQKGLVVRPLKWYSWDTCPDAMYPIR